MCSCYPGYVSLHYFPVSKYFSRTSSRQIIFLKSWIKPPDIPVAVQPDDEKDTPDEPEEPQGPTDDELYPDDGYGVCTDVVAFALKGAGYDLMPLVDEDIRADQVSYNIEQPDKNIDFRRVRNLKVYFEHRAISLTTDLSEIEEWQGGDIVIFQDHIGIVSDRRNENGVPYVIHHNSPWQKKYEQDILEKRNDLVGHYRISQ